MKTLLLFSCFVVVCFGQNQKLIGANHCTWGPSYWCSHVRHSKECGTMDSCITQVWSQQKVDVKTGPQCTFCELAVKEARRMLQNKATERELELFLSKICAVIPSASVKQECQDLVDNYLPEMIALITSEVDDKVVCTVFGFCEKKESKNPKYTLQYFKGGNETYCIDCKKFFGDVREIISSNATEADVEGLLDQFICSNLGPLEDICKDLVEQFTPQLIEYLRQQIDPDEICAMLGFCRSSNIEKGIEMRLRFLSFAKKLTSHGIETCSICKMIAEELQQLDRSKNFQDELKAFVEQNLCTKLGEFEAECKSLVEQYGQQLFEFLAAELDPDVICVTLHLCPQPPVQLQHVPAGMVPLALSKSVKKTLKVHDTQSCEVCEVVMGYVDNLIKENRTEDAIIKALEKVCTIVPGAFQKECDSFINEYGPQIIKLIVEEKLNPTIVCKELHLCDEKFEKKKIPMADVPLIPLLVGGAPLVIDAESKDKSGKLCEICKMLVTLADQMLEKNTTEEEIEKYLKDVCDLLPNADMKNECDSLIQQYLKVILDLLAQELSPEEICSLIELCSNKKHLLGEKECTYGPAYWCASMENAKKCGAVEHCRKHAWKS